MKITTVTLSQINRHQTTITIRQAGKEYASGQAGKRRVDRNEVAVQRRLSQRVNSRVELNTQQRTAGCQLQLHHRDTEKVIQQESYRKSDQ